MTQKKPRKQKYNCEFCEVDEVYDFVYVIWCHKNTDINDNYDEIQVCENHLLSEILQNGYILRLLKLITDENGYRSY